MFQAVECHGVREDAKAFTLSDLSGQRDGLGFAQPVNIERLIPIELLPLEGVESSERTRVRIETSGAPRSGTVTNQLADGKVYVHFDDVGKDGEDEVVDLSTVKYYRL